MNKQYLVAAGFTALMACTPALAHEDLRLKTWLKNAEAKTTQPFEQSQIQAQLGNMWTELKDEQRSKILFEQARVNAAKVNEPYVRELLKGHLANELASGGAFPQALEKLNTIEDTDVWVKTAWKLIGKLAKADETEQAKILLLETETRSHAVQDPMLRAELLSGTGASYRYLDQKHGENLVYEAHGIAQMLSDLYERALMFNESGAHLMDIGHRERAVSVFDEVDRLVNEIENPLHQAKALAMLGGEQAEKGLRDRSVKALDRGYAIASQLPGNDDTYAVLSEIARNYGQSHAFEKAIKVAQSIPDAYHRVEGYIRIAKNQYRQGQQAQALSLLSLAEKDALKVEQPYRQAIVLRKLASERVTAKQPDQAKTLLSKAEALIDNS
ncbi:MAG: hypothetical protein WDZ30_07330 [Cellvibrionaceae bacterium]